MAERLSDAKPAAPDISFLNEGPYDQLPWLRDFLSLIAAGSSLRQITETMGLLPYEAGTYLKIANKTFGIDGHRNNARFLLSSTVCDHGLLAPDTDLSHFFPTLPFATRTLETSVDFTSREKELLLLISLGWENKEIAEELGISWQTVKNLNKGLFTKLEVDNRTEVAIMGLADGLVDASELKTVYADQINCLKEDTLTVRRIEVLKLIARGFNNKEIARELNITEQTVKNCIIIIFRELKARNRIEAAMAYLLNNLPGESE